MQSTRVRGLVLAGVVATSLGTAACSSSGGGSGLGGSAVGKASGSAATAPAGGLVSGGSASSGTNAPGGSQAGGGAPAGAGGDAKAWCTELAKAGSASVALGGSNTGPPAVIKQELEKLVADAPGEIQSDLRALAAIDERVLSGDKSAEGDLAQPQNLARVQHLVKWMQTNCQGIVTDLPSSMPSIPSLPSSTN